jgi:hypothetical protein
MKQRRILPLLLLATLGSPLALNAQTTALELQIYDYTGLPAASVQAVAGLTQQILIEDGLSAQTRVCPVTRGTYCGSSGEGYRQLVVRILARAPKTESRVIRPTLSQAFAGPDGGAFAAIYLERVRDASAETQVPAVTILAYATVHEVGHLLLGSAAHTTQGMMKDHWDRAEYEAMGQHRLNFSKQQIRQMAELSKARTTLAGTRTSGRETALSR